MCAPPFFSAYPTDITPVPGTFVTPSFIPRGKGNYLLWHDSYLGGINTHGTTVGVSATEKTEVANQNGDLHDKAGQAELKANQAKAATAELLESINASQESVRNLVARIKLNPAYTQAIGEEMGIEGPDIQWDPATAKPELLARAGDHGEVVVEFVKGCSEGVNLYCQREGEADFAFLARDTHSPPIWTTVR